jgi:hypothetical protein
VVKDNLQTLIMKNMIILWLLSIALGCKNPEPETYLMPDGFKGRVNVIFNQPNGVPPRHENGRRIYKVPVDGILLTQFKDEYGIVDHQYYYIDRRGNRKSLPIFKYEYNNDGTTKWEIKDNHEIGIFLDGTTGGYGNSNIKYQEFIVTDYATLDSFYLPKYKSDFTKKLQEALHDNFGVDTLTVK